MRQRSQTVPAKRAELLDKKRFAKLVAPYKRLHGSVAAEEILNFTVLINALRGAQDRGRNHLQRSGIHDAITLEAFRLLAVKHGENHAARPQQFRQISDQLLGYHGFEIVEQVPEQNSVKGRVRILQVGLEEARGARCGRDIEGVLRGASGGFAEFSFLLHQK